MNRIDPISNDSTSPTDKCCVSRSVGALGAGGYRRAVFRKLRHPGAPHLGRSGLHLRIAGTGVSGRLQLLAAAALHLATTPALSSYPVSHAYRDRARSDYTLIEPREASDYLMPEPDDVDEQEDDD